MTDSEYAIRLVVFEYLIPMQRGARLRSLCSAIGKVDVYEESQIMGVMEHLLHLADALLASRGYPTSFVHPFPNIRLCRCPSYNVHALLLADRDETDIKDRRADPPSGIRIFLRR